MPEILQEKDRVARKPHRCSYCGKIINKGETYEWAKLKNDGIIYEYKNHKKCGFIASELWSYIDPDDGMTEDAYNEGVLGFCQTFICPDCQRRDTDYDEVECKDDWSYCTDKIYGFLQTHSFVRESTNRWGQGVWKCREKEVQEDGADAGIIV